MSDTQSNRLAEAVEKLCMILGAHLAHQLADLEQNVKAARLSAIGFSTEEVSMILGVTVGAAGKAVQRGRKARANN